MRGHLFTGRPYDAFTMEWQPVGAGMIAGPERSAFARPRRAPRPLQTGTVIAVVCAVLLAWASAIVARDADPALGIRPGSPVAHSAPSLLWSLPAALRPVVSSTVAAEQPRFAVTALGDERWSASGGGVVSRFGRGGVTVAAAGGALTMSVESVGVGSRLMPLGSVVPVARQNRIVYRRGAVSEWYRNGPLGLEQGFTLRGRPGMGAGPLTIMERVSGGLVPRQSGAQVTFARSTDGPALLRYGSLSAVDASGRALPARLRIARGLLQLRVDEAGARYPVTIDPMVQQGPKLVPSDPTGAPGAGGSVAVSADGNTAIVGGGQDNNSAGAAWVFVRSGSTWTQEGPKLIPSGQSSTASLAFGSGVALSADGNTALIGASGEANEKGAAWIFTRSGSSWTQSSSMLTPSDENGQALFGEHVALSADGNTALIAGRGDNNGTGAAWVFTDSGSGWAQQGPKLTAPGGSGDFASAVALSGDGTTALIGQISNQGGGGAWAFVRSGSTWTAQVPQLTPSDASGHADFGWSVALSGDGNTAMVGGPFDNNLAGAAWVFTRSATTWSQQGAKLTPDDATPGGQNNDGEDFGISVSLAGDGSSGVIGGSGDRGGVGAAWVFTQASPTWTQLGPKLVAADASGAAGFGESVALSNDGGTAIFGGPGDNGGIGAAWAFPIDTVPPAAFDLVAPADGSQNLPPQPTFSWNATTDTGSGVDHYELWIDSAEDQSVPISACSNGLCTVTADTVLAQGAHTWLVKAIDADGNVRTSASAGFTVDAAPPTAVTNSAPADGARIDDATPTLEWTAASDGGSGLGGYRVLIDGAQSGGDLPSSATSYTPPSALADGPHSWQVVAFDQAGNTQPGPTSHFTVDTAAPHAEITANDAQPAAGATVSFDASGSSDPEGAPITDYSWDPEGTGTFTSSGTTPTLQHSYTSPGTYSAAVRVTNSVGLTSTATVTVNVEPTPPSGNVGVLINSGDYATDDPDVQVGLVWPGGTSQALISNNGGFGASGNATTLPLSPQIAWTLEQTGADRLPKTVYVRFLGGPGDLSLITFTDSIILDEQAPTVQSAVLVSSAQRGHAASLARVKSRLSRYTIRLAARDRIVGVCAAAVSSRRGGGTAIPIRSCHRRGILHLSRTLHIKSSKAPRYVRVRNSAGKWSGWRKLVTPVTRRG